MSERKENYVISDRRRFVAGIGAASLLIPSWLAEGQEHKEHRTEQPQRTENWTPVNNMRLYLCAFHVAKENPNFQIEAHHYCGHPGGKVHQCVVYDGRGQNSKLLGVEYIIADESYQKLPREEKKFWHPHAYEILSGQLIAPDMPNQGDDIFPELLTTWGKTWHTWRDPSTEFPLGEPLLMWSFGADGQAKKPLIDARDKTFGISTAEIRERRKYFGFPVPKVAMPNSVNDIGNQGIIIEKDKIKATESDKR
ncbi:DUF1264 domain-containing protein [Candidatus Pacearchaeota archaeon]|nr:DUF1264 domain-containing protein [Candidatus Pacearchaeota archaeon]